MCSAGGFSCFRWLPAPDTRELFTPQSWPTPASLQPDQWQNWLGYFAEVAYHKQGLNAQSPCILWCCYLFCCHICWFPVTTPGLLFNSLQDESHLVCLFLPGPLLSAVWRHTHHLGLCKHLSPSTVLHRGEIFTLCWALRVSNTDIQNIIQVFLVHYIETQTMKSN